MKVMLGISLHSYLYLKLANTLFFLLWLMSFFSKIGEGGRTDFAWKRGGESEGQGGWRDGPNNVCTYE
jgi:hypothetical protein